MEEHFLIRYSFAGFVALFFAAAAFWTIDDISALKFVASGESPPFGAFVVLLAAAPILGVALHGMVLLALYGLTGHSFTDPARRGLAERYRQELEKRLAETGEPSLIDEALLDMRPGKRVPDDSIFVTVYYRYAPVALIDWARRRRSYHLLGISWAVAAPTGSMLGLAAALYQANGIDFSSEWLPVRAAGLCVLLLLWSIGAAWLGMAMKRDVDAMELIWTKAFLDGRIIVPPDMGPMGSA